MIAFSLSRTAFTGLAAALLVGLGASFLTGWLAALSQQPVADLRAMAAKNASGNTVIAEKVEDKVEAAAPAAPAAPAAAAKPAVDHGDVAATPHTPPAMPAAAAPAEAPAPPPAKPQTKLAAAMSQPMLRLVVPPPVAAAPAQPAAADASGGDLLRGMPRELNAEFGRLGDPLRPVYTVEAGLFSADHAADALYQRLDAERYDVYRVDGGSYGTAVRVGAFDDRRLAEAAAVELRARQGLDTRVLRVAPAMMAELAKTMRDGH